MEGNLYTLIKRTLILDVVASDDTMAYAAQI